MAGQVKALLRAVWPVMVAMRPVAFIAAGLGQRHIMIQVGSPALYLLYSAGWRAGFTVNGIPPRA